MTSDTSQRAREIAEFLNIPEAAALAKLSQGFGALHAEVNADFRRANPQTDEDLLAWYRTTEAYIWELTAYHLDPGFNYSGMCQGIAERLKNEGSKRVLCLGDGIGDLTISLFNAGIPEPMYHDLAGSRTAAFARHRLKKANPAGMSFVLTNGWDAQITTPEPGISEHGEGQQYDAVVSLDFLEHCVDVAGYTKAIYDALKPGGWMMTQNAFGCGSGPDGSIPMHLTINDRYVTEWDSLCSSIGFRQSSSNWYRKPA